VAANGTGVGDGGTGETVNVGDGGAFDGEIMGAGSGLEQLPKRIIKIVDKKIKALLLIGRIIPISYKLSMTNTLRSRYEGISSKPRFNRKILFAVSGDNPTCEFG
jgi:hypothetical protein